MLESGQLVLSEGPDDMLVLARPHGKIGPCQCLVLCVAATDWYQKQGIVLAKHNAVVVLFHSAYMSMCPRHWL